ncbi:MAG: glycine cleavage system protein GcvH [Coleofasciculaceae cyanobacterium RL_1_1]|nr:glycine cleavage system protein GcvH [Coleofasciculaceae cyanobacterium RL_1_1]
MAIDYPDYLRYLDSHEYIALDGDIATIGLSAFAIDELGDIVFLELPDVEDTIEKGETFGSIESVKAVEDMYAPVTGTVIARNEAAIEAPETLSEDAYVNGWLIKVQLDDVATALDDTLSADEYKARLTGE